PSRAADRDNTAAENQNRERTLAAGSTIAGELRQTPAVGQNRERTPVPGSAIAGKLRQTPAADQNRERTPVPGSAIADKLGQTPASTPKVKPNDAALLPETAAKNGNTEGKPAEMKVANAFDRNPY